MLLKKESLSLNIKKHKMLYVMIIPAVIYFIVFKYIPLLGSVIAFQDYQIFKGMQASPWVGFKNFVYIFNYPDFYRILRNTAIIGISQLLAGFPAPILLALMINEVRYVFVKRSMQTMFYLPHFLSWAILGQVIFQILSQHGFVNNLAQMFGKEPTLFMQQVKYFYPIVVGSYIWKETGWGAIIYLAAIAGINPTLYEAAIVEGASSFKQVIYITLPLIMPTIIIMFLLRIGNFLNLGFEQLYVLMTPVTASVGDILDTYVYRYGIQLGKYSITTAIGLFKSVFGFILLILCNALSKKVTGKGVY